MNVDFMQVNLTVLLFWLNNPVKPFFEVWAPAGRERFLSRVEYLFFFSCYKKSVLHGQLPKLVFWFFSVIW